MKGGNPVMELQMQKNASNMYR